MDTEDRNILITILVSMLALTAGWVFLLNEELLLGAVSASIALTSVVYLIYLLRKEVE